MASENQALLDAIRVIVKEEIAPLSAHIDGLTERFDGLTQQIQRVEVEQREQRFLLESIDLRLTNLEARVQRLEDSIETLDTRTGQIASDLLDLKDQVRDGFRSLKRESELALRQISELQSEQRTYKRRITELEERVALLQQRLERLESRPSE
jgi:chromosome segregation ATPase